MDDFDAETVLQFWDDFLDGIEILNHKPIHALVELIRMSKE